jgi:mannose-6-phosphate isomerase-like protein (cupin superfamily)
MTTKYVFGLDGEGRSDLVFQEDISNLPSFGPGFHGMDLWLNRQTPADMTAPEDPVQGKPMVHEPPDGGAIFRVLDFMPGRQSAEDMLATHQNLQSVHVPVHMEALKDPTMHKTDTLNYFCLLSGELWALSEKTDVLLRPGDVMIQKGCMHGWRNDGNEPARLICVLVDAHPIEAA